MARVPYEIVAIEVDRIMRKMVLASEWEQAYYYWDLCRGYIEACGWTNQEFDNETIRRVDKGWERFFKPRIWN
jgi:hypothetical protein